MRKIFVLLTIIVILPLFTVVSHAEGEVDKYISDFENLLPEGYEELGKSEKLMELTSVKALFSELISVASGQAGRAIRFFMLLVGCIALCALATRVNEKIADAVSLSVGIISSLLIFGHIKPLFDEISTSLQAINGFFTSLIPLTAAVTALGGGTATATAQATAMYSTVAVGQSFFEQVFMTVASLGLAMSLISSFGGHTDSVVKGIKGAFSWLVGICTATIAAAFSLQTLIASTADSAAMRAAKYTAGLIPIVGGTVSGALSTLAAGLSYAKGIIGIGAIAVILVMALSPLILLLLYRLALSLSLTLSELVGTVGIAKTVTAFRFSLDCLIAVYALSAVIYIFEILLFIKIGVAML